MQKRKHPTHSKPSAKPKKVRNPDRPNGKAWKKNKESN